jgi:hypothetical protein
MRLTCWRSADTFGQNRHGWQPAAGREKARTAAFCKTTEHDSGAIAAQPSSNTHIQDDPGRRASDQAELELDGNRVKSVGPYLCFRLCCLLVPQYLQHIYALSNVGLLCLVISLQ